MSIAALTLLLLAADPAATVPDTLYALHTRVHVRANEELDSDHLRVLARKNVTLWLSTRTNSLRASTLESINRFGEAWISLRAPVDEADARQLNKVATAGIWLETKDLDGARRVLGPRKLALKLSGPLEAALAEKLKKLRPSEISWVAPAQVDLLSWSLFRALPGRKLLLRGTDELWPTQCPANPSSSEPTMQVGLESAEKLLEGAFPCGRAPRIEVPLTVDRAAVQALLVREPSVELVIDVGDDPLKASKAKRLLDALGF